MARRSQTKLFNVRGSAIAVSGDMSGALQNWAKKIQDQATRPASRAGALVFYHEMRQKVPVGETQNLYNSIYHAYSPEKSINGKQVYHIGPNKTKAPHWWLVENGHWRVNVVLRVNGRWLATKERLPAPVWVGPTPYIAPTFDGKVRESIAAMRTRLKEKITEINNSTAL